MMMKTPFSLFFKNPPSLKAQKIDYNYTHNHDAMRLRAHFRLLLSQALDSYSNRLFSNMSDESKYVMDALLLKLNSSCLIIAEALALINAFISIKMMIKNRGRLFYTLFPVWKEGMSMLIVDHESFERFLELSDSSDPVLLDTVVYLNTRQDAKISSARRLGEYLVELSYIHKQDYVQFCLMNRGFYPPYSHYLPLRLVSISLSSVDESVLDDEISVEDEMSKTSFGMNIN